jgi:tRNA(Ile2) C34 agmatinyltransferase TiaS
VWPGYATNPRCTACGSRLVKRLGDDDVRCMLRATARLERKVNELEREMHPRKQVALRGVRTKKLMFRVRAQDGEE